MEKRKKDDSHPEDRCPVCGGDQFEWGKLHTRWENTRIGFKAEDTSFLDVSLNVQARHCVTCGNLLLFTEEESLS